MRTRLLLAAGALLVVAACDTGDGTTLRDPAADAPPVSPVPTGTLDTAPADEIVGETATIASVVLTTAPPPPPDPDAPTLPAPVPVGTFTLVAPWEDGAPIGTRYGCDGLDAAPPLVWTDVPAGTAELAVALVDETDLSRGQPFVHWVMTGLDPASPGLGEDEVPVGAAVALNFFGEVGYDGPCPAPGSTNVYALTLYALAQQSEVPSGTPAADVLETIVQLELDRTTITGSSTR